MKCQNHKKINFLGPRNLKISEELQVFERFRNLRFPKKSQFWYTDLILALSIFTLILILAFHYISNNYTLQGKEINIVLLESDKLSEVLMTPGIPVHWTQDNVTVIGISQDNVLNLTKLYYLDNMTKQDYERTKNIFGLTSDFLIYFQDKNTVTLNLSNSTYIGPGLTVDEVQNSVADEITSVTRYVVYRHDNIAEIIAMKVLLWQ